jgi:hypothetical protein
MMASFSAHRPPAIRNFQRLMRFRDAKGRLAGRPVAKIEAANAPTTPLHRFRCASTHSYQFASQRGSVMKDDVTRTATNAPAALAFIKSWFGTTAPAYICSLANDRDDSNEPTERHMSTRDGDQVQSFIAKWDRPGRGLFLCVSTIKPGEKRNKENVAEIPGLWVDIDFKDVDDDEATILRRVKALPKPPSIIVSSGNGLHCYWKFKEPLIINDVDGAETIERVEAALKLLADLVGGDMLVTQVAALMRLPGTHNSKRGNWQAVEIVSSNDLVYELSDIEDEMLFSVAPVVLRKLRPAQIAGEINPFLEAAKALGYKPPIDVENCLRLMLYGGGEHSIHGTQLVVTASMLNAGVPVGEVVSLVLEKTRDAAGDYYGKRWNWTRERKAIRGMCDTWLKKHPRETVTKAKPQLVTTAGATIHKLEPKKAEPKSQKVIDRENLHVVVANSFFKVMKDRGHDLLMVPDDLGVEQCWRYDGDLWSQVGDVTVYLNRELEIVICGMESVSTLKLVAEARALILRHANLVSKTKITFDNHGMVSVKGFLIDPRTRELIPMTKDHHCTWHLGDIYDKDAECPHWLQMLEDSFSDRSEVERIKVIELQQEFLGAALIDRKPKALRRGLVYQGPPDCGKTELIKTMSGLLTDSPISTPLADLNLAHGLQEFTKRVVWTLHEAFDQGVWHLSSRVKSILSGDPLSINPKNQKAITMLMRVVAMWATNSPVKFKESTDAILIRLIIIRMKVKFIPGQLIGTALQAKNNGFAEPHEFVLATEKSGMLNWALDGLQRVLPRGKFNDTDDSKAAADELRLDSNYMAGFIADCIEFSGTNMLAAPDLHLALGSWWKENRGDEKIPPGADAIGRQLAALHDQRIGQDNTKFKDRKGVRYHPGVTLNGIGLDHFASEAAILTAAGRMPPRASLTAADTIKSIPADWYDHPQIKAITKLAKAADAVAALDPDAAKAAELEAELAEKGKPKF